MPRIIYILLYAVIICIAAWSSHATHAQDVCVTKTSFSDHDLTFSPDGKYLVASWDEASGVAHLLNVETGEVERTLHGISDARRFAFSPDGKYLLVGSPDTMLWDMQSGQVLYEAELDIEPQGEFSPYIIVSSNNQYFLLTSDAGTRLYSFETGRQLRRFMTWTWQLAMFSPNSRYILMQDNENSDRGVTLWDIQSDKVVHAFGRHVVYARFIHNGRLIATITTLDAVKEKYIVWDVSTYKQVSALDIGDDITNAEFSNDGNYVVVENDYTHQTIWDTVNEHPLHIFADPILEYQFTPDNRYLIYLVPSKDHPVYHLWDIEKNTESDIIINDSSVTIGMSPNGKYLATASNNGRLRLWNLETGNEMHLDC